MGWHWEDIQLVKRAAIVPWGPSVVWIFSCLWFVNDDDDDDFDNDDRDKDKDVSFWAFANADESIKVKEILCQYHLLPI